MLTKPKVYTNVEGNCLGMKIKLKFDCNITMLIGESSTGKTMLSNMLSNLTSKYRIKVFDYRDAFSTKNEVTRFLKESAGYLIVIDNSDIVLDSNDREIICLNENNQYLLIGRQPDGLFLIDKNFKELSIQGSTIKFIDAF